MGTDIVFHARIQEFLSGGGGGVQVNMTKKPLTTLFFIVFFWSLAYFTEVKWLISKKTIIFQGSSGGSTFSRGSNFFQGVRLFIPYRNPYNL